MRYKYFRIRNFKGIKDTTVHLEGIAGASVFALVGLNESGKTTLLEAIHSFSPDSATAKLLGNAEAKGNFNGRVPRHQISTFTGNVSVEAGLIVTPVDRNDIANELGKVGLVIDDHDFPNEIVFERAQTFERGDFKTSSMRMLTQITVRMKSKRHPKPSSEELQRSLATAFYGLTPDISYFPTFVFNFPEQTFLTERGDAVDDFYREVFQDILDHDGSGLNIEKDIVRRVRNNDLQVPWISFLPLWSSHQDQSKIQHVMDRASASVTKLVFGTWNKIFGEDAKGKR